MKFFINAFQDATQRDHGYMLLDLHPDTPDPLRVRTKILDNDDMTIYKPCDGAQGEMEFDTSPDGYIKTSVGI